MARTGGFRVIAYLDATPADGPALDAMARASWFETFGHSASPVDIAAYLETAYGPQGRLLQHLADPAYAIHLAVEEGAIAGYVKVGPLFLTDEVDTAGALQLHQLYVARGWHGRGVAGALMDWAADAARTGGYASILLTVWEENARALRFYEKRGFVHVGAYAFAVGAQIDRDLILRLQL